MKMQMRSITLAAILAMPVGLVLCPGAAQAQTGPGEGWCTQYVRAKLGLPTGFPDAKNWVYWLPGPGLCYRKVAIPQFGGPIVFQPGAHGVTDTRGHVGIVRQCQSVPGGLRVTVRGANQSLPRYWFVDIYSNVSDVVFFIPNGDPYVSFWIR